MSKTDLYKHGVTTTDLTLQKNTVSVRKMCVHS